VSGVGQHTLFTKRDRWNAGQYHDDEIAARRNRAPRKQIMVEARHALQQLLAGLGEASQFVSAGQLPAVLLGLDVKGIGPIGVPVTSADAKRIIGKAIQAPYGRGEATIVDTDVRRVWQLEPTQFALRNTAWSEALAGVVDTVRRDFGIRSKVAAELYKLLVYEKGSFFKRHRDSEKMPGMFGTLVVCLPSRHAGGMLILQHDGQTKKIDFGGKDSEFQTRYVAFYADCQHEIAPVTSGHRICLVYNLATAGKKQPEAPNNAAAVTETAQLFKELLSAAPEPLGKLAVPFTHQYTEAGFDPKQLKGADRARADVLIRAAESLDYQCYFALLTLHQEGSAEYDSFDYGSPWGRGRSYSSYDDFDDEDEDDGDSDDPDAEFEEIFEQELTLEHWLDPEGREQSFGTIHFEDNEILGLEDKEAWSCKQEVHEATGNEGASMERWYRQGAIVIWPRKRHFNVLAAAGQASALPALEKLAADSKKPEDLDACRKVAEAIIGNWKGRDPFQDGTRSYSGRMLRVLERIGDKKLAMRFLREVLPENFNGSEGKALLGLCQRLGWKAMAPGIQEFLFQQKPANYYTHLNQIVAICEHLCCDPPTLSKERRAACALIADDLMKVVERWDKVPRGRWDADENFNADDFGTESDDLDEERKDKKSEKEMDDDELEALALLRRGDKRTGIVASMVRMLATIGASKYLTNFLAHVLEDARHFDLRVVLIPDVRALYPRAIETAAGRRAASRLLQHCLTELRAATAHPIEPPKDWKREAKLGCRCEDCVALSRFLRDPAERVGRFPVNKQRRRHLHQQIDKHRCDVKHVTERKGSPQTLVCTKTQDSYERRRKQYGIDKELLAELEGIAENQL
jgi:2-oxoglutarate-Fe(II)-dependent oxygenase superfamily protein